MSTGGSAEELQRGASEKKESVRYRVRDRWRVCELGVLGCMSAELCDESDSQNYCVCSAVITDGFNCLTCSVTNAVIC